MNTQTEARIDMPFTELNYSLGNEGLIARGLILLPEWSKGLPAEMLINIGHYNDLGDGAKPLYIVNSTNGARAIQTRAQALSRKLTGETGNVKCEVLSMSGIFTAEDLENTLCGLSADSVDGRTRYAVLDCVGKDINQPEFKGILIKIRELALRHNTLIFMIAPVSSGCESKAYTTEEVRSLTKGARFKSLEEVVDGVFNLIQGNNAADIHITKCRGHKRPYDKVFTLPTSEFGLPVWNSLHIVSGGK